MSAVGVTVISKNVTLNLKYQDELILTAHLICFTTVALYNSSLSIIITRLRSNHQHQKHVNQNSMVLVCVFQSHAQCMFYLYHIICVSDSLATLCKLLV